MKHAVIDLLSGSDSVLELFRMLAALAVVVGLALVVASFVTGKPFDIQAFGLGVGGLLAACGAAIRLREGLPASEKP